MVGEKKPVHNTHPYITLWRRGSEKTSLPRIVFIIFLTWISPGVIRLALFRIMMAPEFIPHAKTDFVSYGEFREAMSKYYPDQLPDSAREIR